MENNETRDLSSFIPEGYNRFHFEFNKISKKVDCKIGIEDNTYESFESLDNAKAVCSKEITCTRVGRENHHYFQFKILENF